MSDVRLAIWVAPVLATMAVGCGGAPLADSGPACADAGGEPLRVDRVIEVLNAHDFEIEHAISGCLPTLAASLSNIPVDDAESREALDRPGHLACTVGVDPASVGEIGDPALTKLMGGDRILLERRLENVKCSLFANRREAVRRLDRALAELERGLGP